MVDDLGGDAAEAAELRRPLPDLLVEGGEGVVVHVQGRHVLEPPADGLQVSALLGVLQRRRAAVALDDHLDSARHALHLGDAADGAHPVEDVGHRVLVVGVGLRHREDELVVLQGGLDPLERLVAAGGDGGRHRGEDDGPAEREDRQAEPVVALGHRLLGQLGGLERLDVVHGAVAPVPVVVGQEDDLLLFVGHHVYTGPRGLCRRERRSVSRRRASFDVHGDIVQIPRRPRRRRSGDAHAFLASPVPRVARGPPPRVRFDCAKSACRVRPCLLLIAR